MLGPKGKKPKYDAVIAITTNEVTEAQRHIEPALENVTKRWRLDEVVNNKGKPSEIYYLVHTRKSIPRDAMVTAIRSTANGAISDVDVEVGDAIDKERGEERQQRKAREKGTDG
jgi:multidrug resistance efflux pump